MSGMIRRSNGPARRRRSAGSGRRAGPGCPSATDLRGPVPALLRRLAAGSSRRAAFGMLLREPGAREAFQQEMAEAVHQRPEVDRRALVVGRSRSEVDGTADGAIPCPSCRCGGGAFPGCRRRRRRTPPCRDFPLRRYGITVQRRYSRNLSGAKGEGSKAGSRGWRLWPEADLAAESAASLTSWPNGCRRLYIASAAAVKPGPVRGRRLRRRRGRARRASFRRGRWNAVPSGPDLPSLTVAFSTRGARALGLDAGAWPAAPGLDFLVLVQEPDEPRVAAHLAALAARPDVTVVRLATTGLARSRNAALDAGAGRDPALRRRRRRPSARRHRGHPPLLRREPRARPLRRPLARPRRPAAQAPPAPPPA